MEDRIRCWQDCESQNLLFASFTQNLAWISASLTAGALLAWAQMTCLEAEPAKAERKAHRYRILHVATVLDGTWPWAAPLRRAFLRRRSQSRGLLFFRLLELAVDHDPVRYHDVAIGGRARKAMPSPPPKRGHPPGLEPLPADRPWRIADLANSG